MVEFTYQMLLSTLQTIALIVGIAYYLFIMRNSQRNQELTRKAQEQATETRQAQLFMKLYNRWSDPEFARYYGTAKYKYTEDILEILQKSVDPYDPEVHTPFHSLGQFFEGMGMLVKKGLVNIDFVDELLSYRIIWWWERMKPMYERERILMNKPELYSNARARACSRNKVLCTSVFVNEIYHY
jgi:hypothetical protein